MRVRLLIQMWSASADGNNDLLPGGAPGLWGKACFLCPELHELAGPPCKATPYVHVLSKKLHVSSS